LGDEKVLGQNEANGMNGCGFGRHQEYIPDFEELN
jgi:hypothetical protein